MRVHEKGRYVELEGSQRASRGRGYLNGVIKGK